jgi:hypothetical protein
MMGWQTGDQRQLFYLFNLERRIPASHLLRRINPTSQPEFWCAILAMAPILALGYLGGKRSRLRKYAHCSVNFCF